MFQLRIYVRIRHAVECELIMHLFLFCSDEGIDKFHVLGDGF